MLFGRGMTSQRQKDFSLTSIWQLTYGKMTVYDLPPVPERLLTPFSLTDHHAGHLPAVMTSDADPSAHSFDHEWSDLIERADVPAARGGPGYRSGRRNIELRRQHPASGCSPLGSTVVLAPAVQRRLRGKSWNRSHVTSLQRQVPRQKTTTKHPSRPRQKVPDTLFFPASTLRPECWPSRPRT
jgi:hypothetical protein